MYSQNETIAERGSTARSSSTDPIPPEPSRMIVALRQIGYSLGQALSDLVDNSINAGASSVLIRFVTQGERVRSVIVADDGEGMTGSTLADAMKFGSVRKNQPRSLGKFGMGLKLASFSHAKALTVITRRAGRVRGRRWTLQGIESGWACETLDSTDARSRLAAPWGKLNLSKHGTLVIWDEVDRLALSSSDIRSMLRALQRQLQLHLGLCFHRFLRGNRLWLSMDHQVHGTQEHGIRVPIEPLDPFGYPISGLRDFPKVFDVDIEGVGRFQAEGHIWPPNSELKEYKLGGRAAARQGFYFYRNDRLIQAGGWNGLLRHESEPHGSLARVRIDLPVELDSAFGLNVQKSSVSVPTGFADAVACATTQDGTTFEDYRHAAQKAYRKHDVRTQRLVPVLPGQGLPKKLAKQARVLLQVSEGATREIRFLWADLSPDTFFDLDRESMVLYLNKRYRNGLLGDQRRMNDAPIVKTLLFFVLEEYFRSDRLSFKRKRKLSNLNTLLSLAAELESPP